MKKENTFDAHQFQADIGKAGFTIKQVCDEAGVNINTFTNWKKGKGVPKSELVQAVLEAFERLKKRNTK